MDDVDRAQIEAEREDDRRAARALARAELPLMRYEACQLCGDQLPAVRQEFGLCIVCARERERRAALVARR